MAKRQSPNLLGIHKEMLEAGKDTRIESLMGGAMQAFAVNIAEQEKTEATMQKHIEDLGGMQNINKLSEEQKGPVTEFLRANRDEYYDLATQYEKTKDPAIKDKMDAIKYRFETLNNQLGQFAMNKAEYLTDYEEGDLAKGPSFDKDNLFFAGVYGDPKAQFTIDPKSGEMSFTHNGTTKALKDFGSHTLRFYEGETKMNQYLEQAKTLKRKGGTFPGPEAVASNFTNEFRNASKNNLAALLQTDLAGDKGPSFIEQWADGTMKTDGKIDGSFYKDMDFKNGKYVVTEENINNLLNNKQAMLELASKYMGNLSSTSFNNTSIDPDVKTKMDYNKLLAKQMRQKLNLGDGATGFVGSQLPGQGYVSGETKTKNRLKIDNRSTYGDYDGYYATYTYRPDTDDYTVGEGDKMEVLTPFDVSKREGITRDYETEETFALNQTKTGAGAKSGAGASRTSLEYFKKGLDVITPNILNKNTDKNKKESSFKPFPITNEEVDKTLANLNITADVFTKSKESIIETLNRELLYTKWSAENDGGDPKDYLFEIKEGGPASNDIQIIMNPAQQPFMTLYDTYQDVTGKKGKPLKLGFDVGDKDAMEKVKKFIRKVLVANPSMFG